MGMSHALYEPSRADIQPPNMAARMTATSDTGDMRRTHYGLSGRR
jgi:hypothetical protein